MERAANTASPRRLALVLPGPWTLLIAAAVATLVLGALEVREQNDLQARQARAVAL